MDKIKNEANYNEETADEPSENDIRSISNANEKDIDQSCIFTVKNTLVRIQYPGIVNNVDKAIENLGGMKSIEKAVSNPSNKLQLNFHPGNKFNKGCTADYDSSSGLLVKVRIETRKQGPAKYSYEIEGVIVRNYTFKKLIDFQYLPLVAEHPETADSKVDYILDAILPKTLPSISTFLSEDKVNMPLFLPPLGFSRSDTQRKITPFKKTNSDDAEQSDHTTQKLPNKHFKSSIKDERASIFHKFIEPDIPREPSEFITQFLSTRDYRKQLDKLEKAFSERPIWTRNGIKTNTNMSYDMLKTLLPAVAYYEITGPWRCTWIRFGYDPRKDPEARKYQNLDYRLPASVRTNFNINPRGKATNSEIQSLQKLALEKRQKKSLQNENSYILRPNMLPQTRQVFYQYCDILLPEIQTMLARLPPIPPSTQCDPKNGWFPTSFIEQCREIVNQYIDQHAAKELLKSNQNVADPGTSDKSAPKSTDLCSLMMKNVKRGLVKPFIDQSEAGPSTSYESLETMSVTEIMDSDNEDGIFQEEFEDMEWDIPDENPDGDSLSVPDLIDSEALEDIKNIIGTSKSP